MRWTKLFRDVRTESGRALIMLAAVAFALLAVSAMLSAYGIVTREVRVNYLGTNPASATIDVDAVTPQMLETAKAFPGIADAEARAVVEARVEVGGEWMRMLLFVVDDFETMRLNLFAPGLRCLAAAARDNAGRKAGRGRHRCCRRRGAHHQDAARHCHRGQRFRHRARHDAGACLAGADRLRLHHPGDAGKARRAAGARRAPHPRRGQPDHGRDRRQGAGTCRSAEGAGRHGP